MDKSALLQHAVHASYFVAAVLFILGIKRMSSPVTARSGIQWAGIGMVVATIATFFHGSILNHPGVITNVVLMVLAIDWNDEVFAQSALTHDGQVRHEPTAKLI